MLKYKIISLCFLGLVYGQCEDYSQSQCGNDNNCEWVEDIETGNCGNLSGDDCELNPECNWNCDFVDDYMGWCNYSCDGGPYEIDNSYCQEIEMPECSEMLENQCDNNGDCEWIEDVEIGNCSDISNSSECYQTSQCSWYSAGNYGYLYDNCYGGTYEIDNSYCEDVEMLECSEMNESECSSDDGCDWIEDINNMSCSAFSNENCVNQEGCFLDQDCNQWGSWYSWICYDYGPLYCSGSYEVDNNYCQEIEMSECSEEYEFQCNDGPCIPIHRVCNNINDCEDESDEINCEDCSYLEELECDNHADCDWIGGSADCQIINTELSCDSNDCEWIEDIDWGNCGDLNPTWWQGVQTCNDPSTNSDNCYTYTCYGGGYGEWNTCCGGESYIIADNSYCDGEVGYCEEAEYQLGDINQDSSINIQDIIIIINLILNGEFDLVADINLDSTVNVLDVIQLVNIILNSPG